MWFRRRKYAFETWRQDDRRHAKSELEGKTVVFTWDDARGEFDLRFDPEGPETRLLAGLTEDVDFRALLPEAASVESGDAWDVEARALAGVLLPGGNLALQATEGPTSGNAGAADPLGLDDPAQVLARLEGDVQATYKGSRDVEGTKCGVIALEFEVHANRELEGPFPEFSHGELEIENVKSFLSFEGDGELLWDLAAGHARTLTLSAKVKNQMDVTMKIVQGDRSMAIRKKMQMSGTYELQAGCERR